MVNPQAVMQMLEDIAQQTGTKIFTQGNRVRPPRRSGMQDYVIEDEAGLGEIAGRIHPNNDVMQIDQSLIHDPADRGKGVGRQLYTAALQMAKQNGMILTSDKTVSGDAARMYRGMAKYGGEDVYDGADTQYLESFENIPPEARMQYDDEQLKPFVNNQNSMGGPVFVVDTQGEGLRSALAAYFRIEDGPKHGPYLDAIEQTYKRLKLEAGEPFPQSEAEFDADPMLRTAIMMAMGGTAAGSTSGDEEIQSVIG